MQGIPCLPPSMTLPSKSAVRDRRDQVLVICVPNTWLTGGAQCFSPEQVHMALIFRGVTLASLSWSIN